MSGSEHAAATIRVTRSGPYRVEGPIRVIDARGRVVCEDGVSLLCRCGGSRNQPLCDGTHVASGFDGTETADRGLIEDRRKAFAGRGVTIHDDRSLCAHIGRCTDELPAVFRLGKEPWIDADAAAPADVAQVVRRCPSGAITYALDPDPEPVEEPTVVEVRSLPDASLEVRGNVEVVAVDGERYEVRAHQTLCRCGHSANKPFCDGAHWDTGFRDPADRGSGSGP